MKIKQKFQLPGITRGMLIGAALAAVIVGGTVTATVYVPPVARPPEGNIPSAIWNSMDSYQHQVQRDAAISIDGGGPGDTVDGNPSGLPIGISVGSSALKMGKNNGGQNLFYGVADRTEMNANDHLMLLQSFHNSVYENRLAIDGWGNVTVTGDITTTGQVTSTGCFGPALVGITPIPYTGDLNGLSNNLGYYSANAVCSAAFASSHVCLNEEILNSLKCADSEVEPTPIEGIANGTYLWVNGGVPGHTTPANDCIGWTSSDQYNFGRVWKTQANNGGQGYVTTCNQGIKFACCK